MSALSILPPNENRMQVRHFVTKDVMDHCEVAASIALEKMMDHAVYDMMRKHLVTRPDGYGVVMELDLVVMPLEQYTRAIREAYAAGARDA